MLKNFFRRLHSQRGQSLLVMTFLVLLILGALASREMLVGSFVRSIAQNSLEDKWAKEMSDSGLQDGLKLIAELDERLDTNADGLIDSRDEPFISPVSQMEGGEYQYRVRGVYNTERIFYFRLVPFGNPWTNVNIKLTEEDALSKVPIGDLNILSSATTFDLEYRASVYPGDFDYMMTGCIQGNGVTSGHELYVRVRRFDNPEPFSTTPPNGSDESITFLPNPTDVCDPNAPSPAPKSLNTLVAATDISGTKNYDRDTYEIESSGLVGSQRHNTVLTVRRNDLLKYAFFSNNSLHFTAGTVINGFVYAGTTLSWAPGSELLGSKTLFRRPVRVADGPILDPGCSTETGTSPNFYTGQGSCVGLLLRPIDFGSPKIQLLTNNQYYDETQPIAVGGAGRRSGWYISGGGPTVLNLDLFQGLGTASASYDLGGPDERDLGAMFNGLVFADGPLHITGGTIQGQSMTFVSRNQIRLFGSVRTGRTPDTREPINIGLVGGAGVVVDATAPRHLILESAIYAADPNTANSWYVEIDQSNPKDSHPIIFDPNAAVGSNLIKGTDRGTDVNLPTSAPDNQIGGCDSSGNPQANGEYACGNTNLKEVGVYDLDGDGLLEPDPANSFGWDEFSVFDDPNTPAENEHPYFLLVRGPIITDITGSAGAWAWLAMVPSPLGYSGTTKQPRTYQYDPDITRYAPPYFPVPLNAIEALSFSESVTEERFIEPTPTP